MSVSESILTPLAFLDRSAYVWAERIAVRDGGREWTYADHANRVRTMAGVLRDRLGVAPGDRVAALLPNVVSMLELHYAVPGAGAVLVPLNTRLAAADYAYVLDHSGASVVFASTELRPTLTSALEQLATPVATVVWVDVADPEACEYEALLAAGQPVSLVY